MAIAASLGRRGTERAHRRTAHPSTGCRVKPWPNLQTRPFRGRPRSTAQGRFRHALRLRPKRAVERTGSPVVTVVDRQRAQLGPQVLKIFLIYCRLLPLAVVERLLAIRCDPSPSSLGRRDALRVHATLRGRQHQSPGQIGAISDPARRCGLKPSPGSVTATAI